jgi:hypothetical protein
MYSGKELNVWDRRYSSALSRRWLGMYGDFVRQAENSEQHGWYHDDMIATVRWHKLNSGLYRED